MARRLLTLISLAILALPFIGTACWCEYSRPSQVRVSLLDQLSSVKGEDPAVKTKEIATSVRNALATHPTPAFREEVRQLGLDLMVYRWAVKASGTTPDVKNINEIVTAIIDICGQDAPGRELLWANEVFAGSARSPKPSKPHPTNDARGQQLLQQQKQIGAALDYIESRPGSAIDSLKSATKIADDLQLDLTPAYTSGLLGDIYLNNGQIQQAEDCYNDSINIYRSYNCLASCAPLLSSRGQLYQSALRYPSSADSYMEAGSYWVKLAEQSKQAYYHNLAGAQYMLAGKALIASGKSDKRSDALKIMEQDAIRELNLYASASGDYQSVVNARMEVADIRTKIGDTQGALYQLKSAKTSAMSRYGNPLMLAKVYQAMAKIYQAVAASYTASNDTINAKASAKLADDMRSYATKSLNGAAWDGDAASVELAKLPNPDEQKAGPLLAKLERGARAYEDLQNLAKAANLWKAKATACEKLGMIEEQVSSLDQLASVRDRQGQTDEAMAVWTKAAAVATAASKWRLAQGIMWNMVDKYRSTLRRGDLTPKQLEETRNSLKESFQQLQRLFDLSKNVWEAARVLEALGGELIDEGDPGSAIPYLQGAIARYGREAGDPWAAAKVALLLASAQVAAGRSDEAQGTLESAQAVERQLIYEEINPNGDQTHSETVRAIYRDLISIYISAGDKTAAERLLKKSAGYGYAWRSDLVMSLRKSTNTTVAKYAAGVDLLTGPEDNPATGGVRKLTLLASTWESFPIVCGVRRNDDAIAYNALPVNPLDIYRLRRRIPANTAIVSYLLTSNAAYVFICSSEKASCWRLASEVATIEAAFSKLQGAFYDCEETQTGGTPVPPVEDFGATSMESVRKPLSDLYDLLIDPIKSDLAGKQLLVFALPDELAGMPAHALMKKVSGGQPRFLVQDFAVAYLGEGMLDNLLEPKSGAIIPASDTMVILADPRNNLPGARLEADAVCSIYTNSKRFVGDTATPARLFSEGRSAGILHVASHLKLDRNPKSSFVLQLAPDENSVGNVGLQELAGLQNDKLKLVVLSACDALGSSEPTLNGVSRAAEVFTNEGAKSVLGSLWKVSDDAAKALMQDFYTQIMAGKTKAEAIRQVQLHMIGAKQYAHPFYWACFALYGNTQ